jgi:hypothetical protein
VELQKKNNGLPPLSKDLFADLYHFLLNPPKFKTYLKFKNPTDQKYYGLRLLHRSNVMVHEYKVINIHKIGINAPGKNIFEELLKWDENSLYWPNNLARIKRIEGTLDRIQIYLFGLEKILGIKPLKINGFRLPQLFRLEKRQINFIPKTTDLENECSLLYDCAGGYPIGIFSLYVRSSKKEHHEEEMSQLFFTVAFDFFGLKKDRHSIFFKSFWEKIHNRVTANVLNRIKLICESKFDSIKVS